MLLILLWLEAMLMDKSQIVSSESVNAIAKKN